MVRDIVARVTLVPSECSCTVIKSKIVPAAAAYQTNSFIFCQLFHSDFCADADSSHLSLYQIGLVLIGWRALPNHIGGKMEMLIPKK